MRIPVILILSLGAVAVLAEDAKDPLLTAAEKGDVVAVTDLLAKGTKVDVRDERGWTALTFAAKGGHAGAVKLLIAKGAKVNVMVEDVHVYNTKTREARNVIELLNPQMDAPKTGWGARLRGWLAGEKKAAAPALSFQMINGCGADSQGYWLKTNRELCFVDPDKGVVERWPFPPASYAVFAEDGEYLWLACSSPEKSPSANACNLNQVLLEHLAKQEKNLSHVLVLHRPSRQWVGCFKVHSTVKCIGVSSTSVFLGLHCAVQPVLEVNKRTVLSNPKANWVPMASWPVPEPASPPPGPTARK